MRNRVRGWASRFSFKYFGLRSLLVFLVIGIYCWRLVSLTPGSSQAEDKAIVGSSSLHQMLMNPANLPHQIIQFLIQKMGHQGLGSMRVASVFFALAFIGCFYYLAKFWFGSTIGIYSTMMFAFTPLIILSARNASSVIMLASPIAVLSAYINLTRHQNKPDIPWLVLLITCSLCLYTPGLLWLFVIAVLFMRKQIISISKNISTQMIVISLICFCLLLVPMLWGLFSNISAYRSLLLIPVRWPSLTIIAKSIGWSILSLFWRTPAGNPLIIGRLPILDIFQTVLVIFGAFIMWNRARRQMLVLTVLLIASIVFAGINNNIVLLTLSLPALAILAGAGLRYLYIEWRSIFPKNPLPIGFALALITILVGLQVAYGIRYSLVAWPNTAHTKELYMLK